MQVRADILGKRVIRPESTECVMGTAAVAASKTLFPDLGSAVQGMVKPGDTIEPDSSKVDIYSDHYHAFREACARRGYG
jgi:ribulose kinase